MPACLMPFFTVMSFSIFILNLQRFFWKLLMYSDFFSSRELKKVQEEYPKVLSLEETVDRVIAGASLSRFGDGEFTYCCLKRRLRFQVYSETFVKRLLEVLHTQSDKKILICIFPSPVQMRPPQYSFFRRWCLYIKTFIQHDLLGKTSKQYRKYSFFEWYYIRNWQFIKRHLISRYYGDTSISRVEVFRQVSLDKIKAIWNNRDVVFIVPKKGKFVYDERLFGNMKSFENIDVEPVNAFEHYNEILDAALKTAKGKENPLFFIAAGPTATLLAYDLYKAGYQALDMGHFPNCYHEYLGEAPAPEMITQQEIAGNKRA
jgi:hypothetical protein